MTCTWRTTNYWRKGSKKTTENGDISHAHELVESTGKNGYTTKSNLQVQHNSHQNSNYIHHRDWKICLKVHLETQKTVNSQGNTQQKSNTGSITIPDFKLYYRAIAIKTAW
jgi:hypothetical protein